MASFPFINIFLNKSIVISNPATGVAIDAAMFEIYISSIGEPP